MQLRRVIFGGEEASRGELSELLRVEVQSERIDTHADDP
uniref:Uncharacterized protein n=1 Tax=Peronospora matthiolae TaxID=2874970 RepID=A0AAV1U3J6_9STRA